MSRLILGFTQEAANGGGGGLNPFSSDTDWRSEALPGDWVEDGPTSPVYDAEGIYTSDNSVSGGSSWLLDASATGEYDSFTLIMAYNVTAWSETNIELLIDGAPLSNLYTQFYPTASTADLHASDVDTGGDSTSTDNALGVVVIAATLHTDGTFKLFKFNTGSAPVISTQSLTPVAAIPTDIVLRTSAYDPINAVSGTASNVKITHTYIGLNDYFDESAVISQATSWGWVENPFDAATYVAAAVVDQDWTGLGGTPAGWTINTGTPIYHANGLRTSSGLLKATLDTSGLAVAELPGWLLNIYDYTDYTTHGFESWTADATEDTTYNCLTEYGGGTDIHVVSHRIEVIAGVDAEAIDGLFTQTVNPSANRIFAGPLTYVADGFDQYCSTAMFPNSDTDGIGGEFSGGPFTPPGTTGFDPSTLDHISIRIFDSVPSGTTLVRTLFFTDFESVANFDNFMAVMVELGYTGP